MFNEPPDAEPHVRWCGRAIGVTRSPTRCTPGGAEGYGVNPTGVSVKVRAKHPIADVLNHHKSIQRGFIVASGKSDVGRARMNYGFADGLTGFASLIDRYAPMNRSKVLISAYYAVGQRVVS